jgi:long-subunit fatty acid transport protein
MIKRVVLAFALSGICISLHAQTIDDALKFSAAAPAGTTRGQSVGGALGALGGEVSSIYVNPASLGFFRTSDFSFTVGLQSVSNKGTYLGTTGSDNKTVPMISNVTMIFGGKRKKPDSKWQNFSFGMGINRTNNYNERVYYKGNNSSSSLSLNYYLDAEAAGVTNPSAQLGGNATIGSLAHSSALAYQTGLIEPYPNNAGQPDGTFYSAAQGIDRSVNVRQENIVNAKGASNEMAFSFASNYNDQLYLGGSLNIPVINYEHTKTWKETNINTVATDLNNFEVTEFLKTEGTGVNFKLGAIFKPIKPLSVGATFHSPSWLTLTDTYSTNMTTSTKTLGVLEFSSKDTYDGFADESKYKIRTPWKGVLSATYLFSPSADTRRPTGFITFDYEYMDYASMRMRFRNDNSFDKEDADLRNDAIKSTYQGASNIRVGGELKLHVIAFRLGYALYGSPYKNASIDGKREYYTGGIGYRNRGFYMDLGLVYGNNKRLDQPYVLASNAAPTDHYTTPAAAEIKNTSTSIITTFGWKF